jgi:plastocyanin
MAAGRRAYPQGDSAGWPEGSRRREPAGGSRCINGMHRRSIVALVSGLVLLGISAALPLVARAGGGCHVAGDGSVYTEGPATVVRMDICSFAPTVARVPEGTTIRFLNTATIQHQVIGRAQTWGTALLDPGDDQSVTFDDAGTYPYMCPLHPGMIGAIVVGSGEGAAALPAAASDATTLPILAEGPPSSDPMPVAPLALAVAGLVGLVVGLLAARLRPRTTG